MLLTQTLDKLDALGLFGMVLGLREQLESKPVPNFRTLDSGFKMSRPK